MKRRNRGLQLIGPNAALRHGIPGERQLFRPGRIARDERLCLLVGSRVEKLVWDAVTTQEAAQSGVQPVMINVREKDQMKQQKAYLGAVVQMGDKSEAIPFMQPGAAMEYALSSSIKKLSVE